MRDDSAPPRLVSSTVAARALGVHPGTLWRWYDLGKVTPALRTPGKHLRWDLDDLRRQVHQLVTAEEEHVPEPATSPERPSIVAAIVTSHLGVLATRRNDGKPLWGFVTGEIEPGESQVDAAIREVKEETGMRVHAGHVEIGRRVHPHTGRLIIYLACSPTEGTDVFVGDEEELAEVRWLSLAEVDELMPSVFDLVRDHLDRLIS